MKKKNNFKSLTNFLTFTFALYKGECENYCEHEQSCSKGQEWYTDLALNQWDAKEMIQIFGGGGGKSLFLPSSEVTSP